LTIRRLCCKNLWHRFKLQNYPRGIEQGEHVGVVIECERKTPTKMGSGKQPI
jgi:hypothetical protein